MGTAGIPALFCPAPPSSINRRKQKNQHGNTRRHWRIAPFGTGISQGLVCSKLKDLSEDDGKAGKGPVIPGHLPKSSETAPKSRFCRMRPRGPLGTARGSNSTSLGGDLGSPKIRPSCWKSHRSRSPGARESFGGFAGSFLGWFPPTRGAGKDVSLSNSPSHSAPSPPGPSPSYPCGKSGGSIRLDCPISAQLEHLGTAKPAHIGPISHLQTSTASALFSVEFGTTLQELGVTPGPFLPQITHQGEVTLYQDFPNPSEPGSSPCPAPSPILLFLPQNVKVSLVDLFPKKHFCLNHLLWSPRRCGTFPGTSMGSGQTLNPPTPGGTGAVPFHSISGRRILKYSLLDLWKGVFELF